MGAHLVDPRDPVGDGFTRTFIYGQYDGRITFIEPMITKAHLESVAARAAVGGVGVQCDTITRPAAWQRPGWYPKKICVRYAAGRYTVSLDDFTRG